MNDSCSGGFSKYFALRLFELLGWQPTLEDERAFARCRTIRDIMDTLLLESTPVRELFLTGTSEGLGNLREFYVALLLEAEWTPRPGYDMRKIFECKSGDKIGYVEVRGSRPSSSRCDSIKITDCKGILNADVLVAVCMRKTFHPLYADMFAIPREPLTEVVQRVWDKRGDNDVVDRRVEINIFKNRYNKKTSRQCKWWEFWVPNHHDLKNIVHQYVDGDFRILPQQLLLF